MVDSNRDVVKESIEWVNDATPDFDAYLNKAKQHITLLSVELTQTRAQLEKYKSHNYDLQSQQHADNECIKLITAENERLRRIAEHVANGNFNQAECIRLAREALKGDDDARD